jgi:hypothetical protein
VSGGASIIVPPVNSWRSPKLFVRTGPRVGESSPSAASLRHKPSNTRQWRRYGEEEPLEREVEGEEEVEEEGQTSLAWDD